jgi:hypothetical protein
MAFSLNTMNATILGVALLVILARPFIKTAEGFAVTTATPAVSTPAVSTPAVSKPAVSTAPVQTPPAMTPAVPTPATAASSTTGTPIPATQLPINIPSSVINVPNNASVYVTRSNPILSSIQIPNGISGVFLPVSSPLFTTRNLTSSQPAAVKTVVP